MARKSFIDILNSGKVDLAFEYSTLQKLFYEPQSRLCVYYSIYEYMDKHFVEMPIHGTCLSLDDFDTVYSFCFDDAKSDVELDDLILFMEYVLNLIAEAYCISDWSRTFKPDADLFVLDHIKAVCRKIGHKPIKVGDRILIVEDDPLAFEAAQELPDDKAYLPFQYHHHSLKGDVEGKRKVLRSMAHELESRRGDLEAIDKPLANDLFFLLNNLNIRHNNVDETSSSYKPYVASMGDPTLEAWYDRTFRMALVALAQLNDSPSMEEMDALKENLS